MLKLYYEDKRFAIVSEEAYTIENERGHFSLTHTRPRIGDIDLEGYQRYGWKAMVYHVIDKGGLVSPTPAEKQLSNVDVDEYGNKDRQTFWIGKNGDWSHLLKNCTKHSRDTGWAYYKKLEKLEKDKRDLKLEEQVRKRRADIKMFESVIKPTLKTELLKFGLRITEIYLDGTYEIRIANFVKLLNVGLAQVENRLQEIFKQYKFDTKSLKNTIKPNRTQLSQGHTCFTFKIPSLG